MSNARYRQHAQQPGTVLGQSPQPVPTTEELLDHAKRLLGMAVKHAEKSLEVADGKYTPRDCQAIVKQILDVAKLERRALDRADRLERDAKGHVAEATTGMPLGGASGTVRTGPETARPLGQSPSPGQVLSPEPAKVEFHNSLPRAESTRAAG